MQQLEMFCGGCDEPIVATANDATYVVGNIPCHNLECSIKAENKLAAQEMHLRRTPFFDDA